MKVLITQVWLEARGGTESVVRDIAIGLLRRGHQPIVYSPSVGEVGAEIRKKGIPVVDDLRSIGEQPDVIHGHHFIPTAEAVITFPGVPAINVCHAWEFWVERPVKFPQVQKYVAVSGAVRDRLVHEEGISPQRVVTLPNAVDLERIPLRKSPLARRPLRAACFATTKAHVPVIEAICRRNGIQFSAIGKSGDRPSSNIEEELINYDIVFATGRSALEAACCGCAVVVCDDRGCAGMLKMSNLNEYRNMNFALRLLANPLSASRLQAALDDYDAEDAAAVSQTLRERDNLDAYLDRLTGIYETAMAADRNDFQGASYNACLLEFLHSALPRRSSDGRWPWLAEREFLIGEVKRLDAALFSTRTGKMRKVQELLLLGVAKMRETKRRRRPAPSYAKH